MANTFAGFMEDAGRANVAITRAKEVFWIVGGAMGFKARRKRDHYKGNLLTQYKEYLDRCKLSHLFT